MNEFGCCTSFALLIVGAADAQAIGLLCAARSVEKARALKRRPTLSSRCPSNDGVVAAGRVVHATYVGGGKRHLTTAISVDGVRKLSWYGS